MNSLFAQGMVDLVSDITSEFVAVEDDCGTFTWQEPVFAVP
jgi:hypothetical protein